MILKAITGCLITVFAADFLFWGVAPGISVSLFGVILLTVILALRPSAVLLSRTTLLLTLLLVGALLSSALEISFTNICVQLALFTMLSGETFFINRSQFWARWLSQAGAIIQFPGRLFWIRNSTIALMPSSSSGVLRIFGWFAGVLLPVILLTALFALILGAGNAIFGSWVNQFFSEFWKWLASFDFSIGRLFFWVFVALLSLSLIQPAETSRIWWGWMDRVVRFPAPSKPSHSYWRSVLILAALNAIFFAANSIDAVFLWAHQSIPQGVTYAEFVHQGTAQLIGAILLSAIILVVLFNQDESISGRSSLRAAALFWIAQNLFLLASIALRLKLYVDAYSLTELRISLLIFLLIVSGGFIIISCKLLLEKSLLWLFGANLALLFTVFYIVQFIDLGAIAAGYNVSRWEQSPSQHLDIDYLKSQGSSGWKALMRAAKRPDAGADTLKAREALEVTRARIDSEKTVGNWRSWQARRAWNLHNLVSTYERTRDMNENEP